MGKVTALMMDVITEKSGHNIVPNAVSVCITPAAPSPLPIPYPVMASSVEGITDPPMRTKVSGEIFATTGSVLKTCHGNEPGTLKETCSFNTGGPVFIIMGAPTVISELGMMGITGAMCISNKAITVGAGGSASDAGGGGGSGGGAGGGGGGGPGPNGPGGASNGGGGGGGSNSGAGSGSPSPGGRAAGGDGAPGSSSGPADQHQCQNGHPVDMATGYVIDQAVDFELPGRIPFAFKRFYSSGRHHDVRASLGPGWAHPWEMNVGEAERSTVLRDAEGRSILFEKIAVGATSFHRGERMELTRLTADRYEIFHLTTRFTYRFEAFEAGGLAALRHVRDAWDNRVELSYEGGRLTVARDSAGREIAFHWRGQRLRRVEVRAGGTSELVFDYEHNERGLLVAATDPLGHSETFEYDAQARMVATTLKTGITFRYEFEADTARCSRTWGPKGLYDLTFSADLDARRTSADGEEPREYTVDGRGHVTREALPGGAVLEERAYDDDGYLIADANGAGEGNKYWYDARGNLVRSVDPTGATTAWEYDERDLAVRKITPDGAVTLFAHDDRGALARVTFPTGRSYTLANDDRGRLVRIDDADGTMSAYEYDAQHNVVAETDARGARTVFHSDALGRPIARTDALGRMTRLTRDPMGRVHTMVLPGGGTVRRSHDANGNLVREIDPRGAVSTLAYSGMDVLTQFVAPDGGTWRFKYTGTERLSEVRDPKGQIHSYRYDEGGRVVEERTFDGVTLRFEIDAAGRVAKILHPDDTHRRYGYDRAGRVVLDEGSDGSVIRLRRDKLGRLVEAILEEGNGRHVTLFERDPLGRILVERQGDIAVRYTYDAAGRVVERVLPHGASTRFAYDRGGLLSGVEQDEQRFLISRDAVGREEALYPEGRRFVVRHAYDAADRLIEQRVDSADAAPDERPLARNFGYDRSGRVSEKIDPRWGITRYEYDEVSHLLAASSSAGSEAFRYDPAGSIVARYEGQATPPEAWKVGPGGLVVQTPTAKYVYDARHRRVGERDLSVTDGPERVTTYRWDVRDRLREIVRPDGSRVVVHYDALGRRVREDVAAANEPSPRRSTVFVHCGNALVAELPVGGAPRVFVHRPGSFVPLLHVEHGEIFVTVCDPVGTPLDLIDRAGQVAWSASRGAFGEPRDSYDDPHRVQSGKRVSSPFRLLGQVHDAETGLAWTRFRVFDAAVARWLSADPWGIEGGYTPFGFDGAPTIDVDPLGLTGPVHRPGAKGPNVPPGKAVTVERTPEGLTPTSGPLSPEEARRRLARGEDTFSGDRATAAAVAGRGAIGPETHPAEGENRFPHFHRSDREGGHSFFGGG